VLGSSAVGGVVKALTGNEQIGGLIQGAGSLLGGGGTKSATPTTNAPAGTNQPKADLIKGLGNILGNKVATATNSPATNRTAPATNQPATNKSTVNDLLNDLLKPKKQ
jgi:hypothetical protein